MGFVVEGRDWSDGDEEGEPSFSAFVFESNTEGEKVDTPNADVLFSRRGNMLTEAQIFIDSLSFCLYSQICYTISLAKDITEAKKVSSSSWKHRKHLLHLKSKLLLAFLIKLLALKA